MGESRFIYKDEIVSNVSVGQFVSYFVEGTADSGSIWQDGVMYLSSGGSVLNMGLKNRGEMTIYSGAVIKNLTVESNARINGFVYSNTNPRSTTLSNGLHMDSHFIIKGAGTGTVYGDQSISGITLTNGNLLMVHGGGTILNGAFNIIASSGANLSATNGAQVTGDFYAGATINGFTMQQLHAGLTWDTFVLSNPLVKGGANAYLYDKQSAVNMLNQGTLTMSSGGVVDLGSNNGTLNVSSGASVDHLSNGGTINLYEGDSVRHIRNSGGKIWLYENASASQMVNVNGSMIVLSSGARIDNVENLAGTIAVYEGSAYDATLSGGSLWMGYCYTVDGGYGHSRWASPLAAYAENITILSGAVLSFETYESGGNSSGGGRVRSATVSKGGSIIMHPYGGRADNLHDDNDLNDTEVLSGGQVSYYGRASNAVVEQGGTWNQSGGTLTNLYLGGKATLTNMSAFSMFVSSGASLHLGGGVTADYAMVNSGGYATTVNNATLTDVTVESGAVINGFTMQKEFNASSLNYSSALVSMNTAVLYNSNTADVVAVLSGGRITVSEGGHLTSATLSSGARVDLEGGTWLTALEASSGAVVSMASGANLAGKINLMEGAAVSAVTGANVIIDYTHQDLDPFTEYLINDISRIVLPDSDNYVSYKFVLSDDITVGNYLLAGGAAGFDQNIMIYDSTMTENIAGINVDGLETVRVEDNLYFELNLKETTGGTLLVLNVTCTDYSAPTISITAQPDGKEETNQDVTLFAKFSRNTWIKEYSLDGGITWEKYNLSGVTVSENDTTVTFRATSLNNLKTTESITVDWIDKIPPEKPVFVQDILVPTKENVTVSANFDETAYRNEYSLNSGRWRVYSSPLVFTENGTVSFRSWDKAGNVSETVTCTVSNIDNTPPARPEVKADITEMTNKDVTLYAVYSEDSTVRQYSMNGTAWENYPDEQPDPGITVEENCTVYFRAADALGNVSETAKYEVTNIDKIPPEAPEVTADITTVTDEDVRLTAVYSSDTWRKEYSDDGENYQKYTNTLVVEKNGTYYFRGLDQAGNISDVTEITVDNIYRPDAPTAQADITDWTRDPVTVTAVYADELVLHCYSPMEDDWENRSKNKYPETGVVFNTNGTVYFWGYTEGGLRSAKCTFTVGNIDLVAPTIIDVDWTGKNPDERVWTKDNVTVTVNALDDLSGIKTMEYSLDGGENWTEFFDGMFEMTGDGTFIIRATDNAGNQTVSETSYEIDNIDKTAPEITLTRDPEGWTNQTVTVTVSAEDSQSGLDTLEYSIDGGEYWEKYTDALVFEENTVILVRAADKVGNQTENEYAVANIDKVLPKIDSVDWDTAWTNQDLTVTVGASDDASGIKSTEYSLDGGENWTAFEGSFILTENADFVVRATDNAGNQNVSEGYSVTNIDKVLPKIDSVEWDMAWTNQDLAVTVGASDDASGILSTEYSLDGGENWTAFKGSFVLTENADFIVRATDNAGNLTVSEGYSVTNIDKVLPKIDSVDWDTAWTNQDLTVTVGTSDDASGIKSTEYSLDGGESWTGFKDSFVLTENAGFIVRAADNAGNLAVSEGYVVNNIDKVLPKIDSVEWDTAWTNQDLTVTVGASDDASGIKSTEYSLDGGENWTEFKDSFVLTENAGFIVRAADNAGNLTVSEGYVVNNIDKVPPTGAASWDTAWTNKPVPVTVTATDNASGVAEILYSLDSGSTWKTYAGDLNVTSNGPLNVRVLDQAGNQWDGEYEIANIDLEFPLIKSVTWNTAPTNQDLTVTVEAFDELSGIHSTEYSLDGGVNWTGFSGSFTLVQNSEFHVRTTDKAGNLAVSGPYEVTNIDKIPPEAPVASADITTLTDQPVTVTAEFSEDSVKKEYSWNQKDWLYYIGGIKLTENGSVYFRGTDAAGNISEVTEYTVGNIAVEDYVFYSYPMIRTNAAVTYSLKVSANGNYSLYGDFGDLSGTMTVLTNGRKTARINIRNGVVQGNRLLLDKSKLQTVQVKITGGTAGGYMCGLHANELYLKGNNSDDIAKPGDPVIPVSEPGPLIVDWVGFGDEIDYHAFSLATAAKLTLTADATDQIRMTLWKKLGDTSSTRIQLKSLGAVQLNKSGTAVISGKLLDAGTYYVSVQSKNASKGGSADYTVRVDDSSKFFDKANNSDDNWIKAVDLGTFPVPNPLVVDWVGMGDEFDYRKFTLENSARLSFTLETTDAVKFTVWKLQGGKLKSLQKTSLKAGQSLDTRELLLEKGDYYFSVQSTKAKKGGDADYTVSVNEEKSSYFPAPDNTNDTWKAAANQTAALVGDDITGWVGFGNASDFIKFELAGDGQIQLTLDDDTRNAFASKQIKLTCLDANGKSVALGALDGNILLSKKPVAVGEYYLGVTCANVKKYDTSYSVTTGLLA